MQSPPNDRECENILLVFHIFDQSPLRPAVSEMYISTPVMRFQTMRQYIDPIYTLDETKHRNSTLAKDDTVRHVCSVLAESRHNDGKVFGGC